MKTSNVLLAFGLLGALTTLLPDTADARGRGGGFHASGARFHAGGVHRGGVVRPGWHGGGTRWAAGGGRYYRGGGYYRRGYGYPVAAGVAAGAALGAAAAYGSSYGSCYQTQSVWNGYTYVNQTVRVC